MKQLAMVLFGVCVACGSKGDGKSDKGDKPDPSARGDKDRKGGSHRSEAKLMLHNLENRLKAYYVEHGAYPKGGAKPLPADVPCCKQPDHLCAVTKEWGSDPVWKELDFQIDEPNRYQYVYASDGKQVQAMAIGQDDCDDAQQTFVLNTNADGTFEVKNIDNLAEHTPTAEEARLRMERAEKAAQESMHDAREARERVEKIETDLMDLGKRLDQAVDAVTAAQSQADRDAAVAKLNQLRKEKAELEQRIADAKTAAAKAERTKGVKVSKECQDNPLAKGCM